MEQRCAGREPLRSSRRRGEVERVSQATLLLLIAVISGPCGEREAVSSQGPRGWKARGQARRAGAPWGPVERLWAGGEGAARPRPTPVRAAQSTAFPWERGQSMGVPRPRTSCGGPAGPLRAGSLPTMRLAAEAGTLVMGGADVR